MEPVPTTQAEQAQFYRVAERTLKGWRGQGAPLHSVEEMAVWMKRLQRAPKGFIARMRELTGASVPDVLEGEEISYKVFLEQYADKQRSDGDTVEQLKQLRAFQLFKLERAQEGNDLNAADDCAKMLKHLSAIIDDEELRAHRLGRELGEIIQRGEVVGYIHALTYWQLRCVDEFLGMIVPKLIEAAAAKPLDRDAILGIVEPPLLDARITKPIERAVSSTGAAALPKWFLESVQESVDRVIEPNKT